MKLSAYNKWLFPHKSQDITLEAVQYNKNKPSLRHSLMWPNCPVQRFSSESFLCTYLPREPAANEHVKLKYKHLLNNQYYIVKGVHTTFLCR